MNQSINNFRFCPRCGSDEFDKFCFKSFKCKNCGFHYYINSAAAVAAIIFNEKGELLLTVRAFEPAKGMLDLPGGFVDPGESAEETLSREIKEELNLDITEFSYFISFPNEYLFSGLTVHTIDFAFVCKVKNISDMRTADDVVGYVFVTKDNIEYSKIGGDSIKKIIRLFFTHKNIK